tara:strand:+ start:2804 stop:2917 length:114 start_codon:yes stop_codon:yes gene_type:complete
MKGRKKSRKTAKSIADRAHKPAFGTVKKRTKPRGMKK